MQLAYIAGINQKVLSSNASNITYVPLLIFSLVVNDDGRRKNDFDLVISAFVLYICFFFGITDSY